MRDQRNLHVLKHSFPTRRSSEREDDAVVKVVVDGEETEGTVGSLKRLAGQEAALTRKSQEVEVVGGRAALMIQGAIEVVLEELAPYKDIDWLTLRDKMEPDEFEWHRDNFNKHQKRYQKLVGDAQNFEQIIEARQSADRKSTRLNYSH